MIDLSTEHWFFFSPWGVLPSVMFNTTQHWHIGWTVLLKHWVDCGCRSFLSMGIITALSSCGVGWLRTQCLMGCIYPYQELRVQTLNSQGHQHLGWRKRDILSKKHLR